MLIEILHKYLFVIIANTMLVFYCIYIYIYTCFFDSANPLAHQVWVYTTMHISFILYTHTHALCLCYESIATNTVFVTVLMCTNSNQWDIHLFLCEDELGRKWVVSVRASEAGSFTRAISVSIPIYTHIWIYICICIYIYIGKKTYTPRPFWYPKKM